MTSTQLTRCVCVIGPQSTGKTTLINALSNRLNNNIPVISEVARGVMHDKGYSRNDVASADRERKFAFQRDIFTAQIEMENTIMRSGKKTSFLSDRSGIDPLVYLNHYSGPDEARRLKFTKEWRMARERYADPKKFLIILLSPVPEFLIDDDIRYMSNSSDDWHSLAQSFRDFLEVEKIPFIEIGENIMQLEERVLLVLERLMLDRKERVQYDDPRQKCDKP